MPGFATSDAKRALVVRRWWLTDAQARVGTRPPLVVCISVGQPDSVLERVPLLEPHAVRGIWHINQGALGETWLVDVKNLEKVPGTGVLRALATPRTPEEAAEMVAWLMDDPGVLPSDKRRIAEAVVDNRIHTDKLESETWLQYHERKAREEGEQRGELRGELRGEKRGELRGERRALEVVLEARGFELDELTRQRIASCTQRATLERWLGRASQIIELTELFDEP